MKRRLGDDELDGRLLLGSLGVPRQAAATSGADAGGATINKGVSQREAVLSSASTTGAGMAPQGSTKTKTMGLNRRTRNSIS